MSGKYFYCGIFFDISEPWKKFHGDDPSGGYATRFRVNIEEDGLEANIESEIVTCMFKTVVTRIVDAPPKFFEGVSKQSVACKMGFAPQARVFPKGVLCFENYGFQKNIMNKFLSKMANFVKEPCSAWVTIARTEHYFSRI